MSLIVPQITAWLSLSEHPVQGPECHLATVIREDSSFHSLLYYPGILSMAAFYLHSLITLANLPPVGLTNARAGRNRSEENVYTIEENIYEIENANEYYCYVTSGQPS